MSSALIKNFARCKQLSIENSLTQNDNNNNNNNNNNINDNISSNNNINNNSNNNNNNNNINEIKIRLTSEFFCSQVTVKTY